MKDSDEEVERHVPIGWDGGRPLDCKVCGEPWPCSARCQRCNGAGQVWDPRVFGNVVDCRHCTAGVPQSASSVEDR